MQRFKHYFLGLLCLTAVIFLWVGAGFLTRHLYANYEFQKPFFITYLNTSSFIFFLLPEFLRSKFQKRNQENELNSSISDTSESSALIENAVNDTMMPHELKKELLPEFTFFETAQLSFQFCFQWFLANYLTNLSLRYTSVSSSTILTATSGPFTLLLSHTTASTSPSLWQYPAVLLTFTGVLMVAYNDQSVTESTYLGDAFALAGALGYAVYATWLPRALSRKKIKMFLFLGLLGMLNVVCLWPFGYILHVLKVESVDWPSLHMWQFLCVNTFLGTFLSEFLWLKAILWTSPITVTLALSMTIPLAILGDSVLHSKLVSIWYLLGACMILLGFISK
ncbi:hypothetical protein HMI56_006491 [Coelomomyces lativittatus]|nr:hypothetical protein HMI56_006491 [Coelomomyces lativittatus]